MPPSNKPLNYTPVPSRDPVADIITASEDAKLLKKARALIGGEQGAAPGQRGEDLPSVGDVAGGLTPEEWLTGLKGFYTQLMHSQANKPPSQTLGKDIARGLVANTIGLVVPPLRERATEKMSPVGQVAAEVLNPVNWPTGGAAEVGVPLSFFATRLKPNAIGLGEGVIKDIERGILRNPTKEIRLHPVDPTTGEFRPLHAGTEYSALERLAVQANPLNETRTPTLTRADLPVRDTLGTFDKPLEDPGGDWVGQNWLRKALQNEGIDAIIYRNSVEGPGEISLEALRDFVNPQTRAIPMRAGEEALGDLMAASHKAANAPYQLTLPLEHFKQSPNLPPGPLSPTLKPREAAARLKLEHPMGVPANPNATRDWTWDDVWKGLRRKYHGD